MLFDIRKKKKYNVIVVEDNVDHQKLIKTILKKCNFDIDVVNNGKELMEMLALGNKYDLVLLDIQMPVMDGYTVTQMIRNNPKYKNLLIIGLSAYAMNGDANIAISRGMNDYMTKPIFEDDILKVIGRYLDIKR